METCTNKDYTAIAKLAELFGFIQDTKNSNLFFRKSIYSSHYVDLSESGEDIYSVAKNIIEQMIDKKDDEIADAKYNANFNE